MCAVTTWPFFSFTRKVVLGSVSTTSPSIWIASSLDIMPLSSRGRALEHKGRGSAICAARKQKNEPAKAARCSVPTWASPLRGRPDARPKSFPTILCPASAKKRRRRPLKAPQASFSQSTKRRGVQRHPLLEQRLELRPRNAAGAEAGEMPGGELAVDHGDAVAAAHRHQMRQRHFGGIARQAE